MKMTYPSSGPWAVPPPQQPPQPPKNNTGKVVGFSCLGILGALVLIGACSAAITSGGDGKDNDKPATTVTQTPDAPTAVTAACQNAVEQLLKDELAGKKTPDDRPGACAGITDEQWSAALDKAGDDLTVGDLEDLVTPTPEPEPAGPATSFSTGTYLVGEDIKAGTYKTKGPETGGLIENCYWSRNKDDSGEFDAIIANENLQGPGRVTLKKGEVFETNGCQEWRLAK